MSQAGNLLVGDKLVSVNGEDLFVEEHSVELTEKPVEVYNFNVDDAHTYFVGECKVWVHNASCLPQEKYLDRVDEKTGDRYYKRTLEDGKVYEVRYSKNANGDYSARFEPYATHPDFPDAVYPSKKRLKLTGIEKDDLAMMAKEYGKSEGYTWHHMEDGKHMLLVRSDVHDATIGGFPHTGGGSIVRNN